MKKILIGLLVLAVVIVVVVALAFYMTADMVTATEEFFVTAREGDLPATYGRLSQEFRSATSLEELGSFLQGSSLADYKEASWHSRSYENNVGRLEGTVETREGGKIPIVVTLVKEEDAWKILSIEKAQAGIVQDYETAAIPGPDELKRMADESMHSLVVAINSRDFTDFHESVSKLWQAETTPDELRTAFSTFVEQNADLTVLAALEPVFVERPDAGADGVLGLKGYYPSQPSVAHFDMRFIYEDRQWKLPGMGLELK